MLRCARGQRTAPTLGVERAVARDMEPAPERAALRVTWRRIIGIKTNLVAPREPVGSVKVVLITRPFRPQSAAQ